MNGDKSVVYDGVLEGLKSMRDQGLKLAVVTNKPTEFTLPLLQRTGLSNFSPPSFAAILANGANPTPIKSCLHANNSGLTWKKRSPSATP